jgi:hypothetical protein
LCWKYRKKLNEKVGSEETLYLLKLLEQKSSKNNSDILQKKNQNSQIEFLQILVEH